MSFPHAALKALRDVVLAVFDEPTLKMVVRDAGHDLDVEVASNLPLNVRVSELFRLAFAAGWLGQLLSELEIARPMNAQLAQAVLACREAIGAVLDGWYSLPAPIQSPVVRSGGMANREQLRGYLQQMTAPIASPRLLLLRGAAGTGKSFSHELIALIALREGDALAHIDVNYWDNEDDIDVDGASPELVAEAIAARLDLGSLPQSAYTTPNRLVENLARALADGIQRSGRRTWLFIDHLDTSSAKPSVKKLIQKLAFLAQQEIPNLRIVVAGRSLSRAEVFGEKISPRGLEEEVEEIRDDHLERYFTSLSLERSGQACDPDISQQARSRVREQAQGDPYALTRALWEEATRLFRPEG